MDLDYYDGDYPALKEYYFEYLHKRCSTMKEKFMTALGFSNDAETPITSDETPIKKAIFTDEFYRLEKIGIVARKGFEYLITNGLLSENDIKNLVDVKYCKKELGCEFPLYTTDISNTTDHNGVKRYWAVPVLYGNLEYYICSQ